MCREVIQAGAAALVEGATLVWVAKLVGAVALVVVAGAAMEALVGWVDGEVEVSVGGSV